MTVILPAMSKIHQAHINGQPAHVVQDKSTAHVSSPDFSANFAFYKDADEMMEWAAANPKHRDTYLPSTGLYTESICKKQ